MNKTRKLENIGKIKSIPRVTITIIILIMFVLSFYITIPTVSLLNAHDDVTAVQNMCKILLKLRY